jgi:hypothetical protein
MYPLGAQALPVWNRLYNILPTPNVLRSPLAPFVWTFAFKYKALQIVLTPRAALRLLQNYVLRT